MDRRPVTPLQRNDLIRNIPYPQRRALVGKLDIDERWSELLGCIMSHKDENTPRYRYEDKAKFERELQRRNGSPADALLRDWQHVNPTVGNLLTALQSAGLNGSADYVHQEIMRAGPIRIPVTGEEPRFGAAPPYPSDGSYYNVHELSGDSAPPYSVSSSSNSNGFRPLSVSSGPESSGQPGSLLDSDQQQSIDSFTSRNGAKTYNYADLELMTDMFNDTSIQEGGRLVGRGGFGDVFLAVDKATPDKKMLAVKRFKDESVEHLKQFQQEIQMFFLGCDHKNILKILGICHETKFCVIYEYMPDGSLEDCLKNKSADNVISAEKRMKYAHDIAQGIHELHTLPNTVTHRDIKSANILLNGEVAKIGDFGLARTIRSVAATKSSSTMTTSLVTENVIGSTVYMPPEAYSGKISPKWDVYSYGVVLAELVTGMRPSVKPNGENGDTDQDFDHSCISLVEYLFNNEEEIVLSECIDSTADWNTEQALKLLELSDKCTTCTTRKRPFMKQVLMELEEIEQKYSSEPRMFPAATP